MARTCLSWWCTVELSPPRCGFPQVITDPSVRMAANASMVDWIALTCFSWFLMASLLPPAWAAPQVMTEPSWRMAAKAESVA